jgi:hypothetical protein
MKSFIISNAFPPLYFLYFEDNHFYKRILQRVGFLILRKRKAKVIKTYVGNNLNKLR